MSEIPRHQSEIGDRLRHGGCSCGAVRFAVRGAPVVAGLCHCADCRKETGSAFLYYADWPRAAFSVEGAYATHAGRSFCPTCGSRLFHLTDEIAEIMIGALDEVPVNIVPAEEDWVIRREHWLAPVDGASQYERDPPATVPAPR